MILKHGMEHLRLMVFKVIINDNPGVDLDIFYSKVKFGGLCFQVEKMHLYHKTIET